jgi:Zn-dependent M28 family amino/carboxypeptidase
MAGKSVDELLKASDSRDFRPIPLGVKIRARLNAKIRQIVSRNVLGIVPGSDPKLKDEVVMFGAHWDHLGVAIAVNGDSIYNGAIDNGTGCGIVLEIARSWAALKDGPRRSALFAFWTAEESGLRGAEYYAAHPLIPAPEQRTLSSPVRNGLRPGLSCRKRLSGFSSKSPPILARNKAVTIGRTTS